MKSEAALDKKLEEYKGAVFTEESKTFAKKEVASLRKFKTKFEDARKEREARMDEAL